MKMFLCMLVVLIGCESQKSIEHKVPIVSPSESPIYNKVAGETCIANNECSGQLMCIDHKCNEDTYAKNNPPVPTPPFNENRPNTQRSSYDNCRAKRRAHCTIVNETEYGIDCGGITGLFPKNAHEAMCRRKCGLWANQVCQPLLSGGSALLNERCPIMW